MLTFDTIADSQHRLSGALSFATAAAAYAVGRDRIASASAGSRLQFDCQGITEADSAGLAVLIEWLAESKRRAITLRYANLPASIGGLARISGVDALLAGD